MIKTFALLVLALAVSITFIGTADASPIISLSTGTATIEFGTVTVGGSVTKNTDILNTGDADLLVSLISANTGTGSFTEFTWSPDAPLTIAPGGSTTLSITYSPVDNSSDFCTLSIASNDPVRPTIYTFNHGSGTGSTVPVISLITPTVDFGQVTIGSSVTRYASVQNTGGADLVISSLSLCTDTTTEFSIPNPGPFTVAPGASASLPVTYSPADTSSDAGCMTIANNDPVKPAVTVALSGSGIVPPPPTPIDIDITGFSVPSNVSIRRMPLITPSLSVINSGTVSSGSGKVTAVLVGVENGITIYDRTIALDNISAGASANYTFPGYLATTVGTISWTVTVNDTDPDIDAATATTRVQK